MSDTIIQYWDNKKNKAVAVTPDTPLPISGGTPPEGSIGTDQLKDGAVTTPKIAHNAVTVDNIADSSVVTTKIADMAVTSSKIADSAIDTNKLSGSAKAPFAGKADEASAVAWGGVTGKPTDYPPSAHTHPIAQVDGLQDALDGKLSEIADNSVTTAKIADKAVTQAKLADDLISFVQYGKFTPLRGVQNANSLTEEGIYLNVGGYSLTNAPRENYGWMLLVSRGSSNGHPRGAQVYFDHDGFDWRGFDGSTFTDWETCIIKNKITDINPIADPSTATTKDIATAYNALLAALKG